jgi:hypothetical protein
MHGIYPSVGKNGSIAKWLQALSATNFHHRNPLRVVQKKNRFFSKFANQNGSGFTLNCLRSGWLLYYIVSSKQLQHQF